MSEQRNEIAVVPQTEGRGGWGMSTSAVGNIVYPRSAQDVVDAFRYAADHGLTVGFWGNGRSYGDAALNEGQLTLDFSRMNQVISWDPKTGIAVCEPGVRLADLWQHCLSDGYWPPVVSGTMFTTLGGCAAANVHGKNNWKHGPIGDHIRSVELVTPDGEIRTLDRENDPELFHAAIGGFGWLGAFTRITVAMKKVYSGRLEVRPFVCPDLESMFRGFEECNEQEYDYVVGWLDAFARGARLGRGQIHAARYFADGGDPAGAQMLSLDHQHLPSTFFGLIPKAWLWRFMKPFSHRPGVRAINAARYFWMSRDFNQHVERQAHAQFNFLLDYVPDWKFIYKPGGLIQYQLFVPKDHARDVFRRALELQQTLKLESWLLVMKRHRADPFLMSHAVDGYSLAQDFPVTDTNRQRLFDMCEQFSEMVVGAGGRFYFAKDSVVSPQAVRRAFGNERLQQFFAIKDRVDPDGLLQGNLHRRVLAPLRQRRGDGEAA